MKLNNPKKFNISNVNAPTEDQLALIARGEIICYYSAAQSPSETDWTTQYEQTLIYKWIALSFDGGKTKQVKYQVNHVNVEENFIIGSTESPFETNTDSSTKFEFPWVKKIVFNPNVFNEIKNKAVSVTVALDNNRTMNIATPIIFDSATSTIELLFTDSFISMYQDKTCYVKI